jgi:hypothetical protein
MTDTNAAEQAEQGRLPALRVPTTYRRLDSELTVETIARLRRRIVERFPESGLEQVAAELHAIAEDSRRRCEWISQPHYGVRAGMAALVALAAIGLYLGTELIQEPTHHRLSLWEFIQVLESSLNDLILLGAAVVFLVTLESRMKRARALEALNELRAITHVIDMHQLTKDPAAIGPGQNTESSPKRTMTPFQLNRYLDYCSELLALTGKVAALYAQHLPDPVVLSTATELEELTVGMGSKIWQKISMLQDSAAPAP